MFQVDCVTINYLKNPSGIIETPQFGWLLKSDKKNVVQTSYTLQIAGQDTFEKIIYDSGIVESEESAHVFLKRDLPLITASKYYVRVKAVDNYGEEAKWSTVAIFVTGVLSDCEWSAKLVTAETITEKGDSKGTYIRKEFSVKKKIKSAYAYTTALGLYHFYINGEKVGKDQLAPGWTDYNTRLLYQTYEVTSYLQEGNNAVGAMVGAGWFKGSLRNNWLRNIYGECTAFFCQLYIRYEDDSTDLIVTDKEWKGADSPVLFSEIYDGETYDARLEQVGWNEAGFNAETWRDVEIINKSTKILVPQEGCKVREIQSIPAKEIITTPKGDKVIDFGQNLTGWVQFKVKGQPGDKVELNFFEVLDAKGNVYLENLRSAKETIVYICKDENEAEYKPYFTFQGFRYMKIASYPGESVTDNFTAYAVHSDMEPTGSFECSNSDINQLQHNILWGMKGNFLDIPTDCPQRDERLGWTGDAQIFCRTATFLMNTYTFFSKWLQDLAAEQTEEGGVPHIIPNIITKSTSDDWLVNEGQDSAAAWADAAIINPWTLYLCFGDKKIIEQQYESMKAWIEFMRRHAKNGIWAYKLQFGDWVALDAEEGSYFGATPNELVCSAYYAYSTGLFAKMARAVGNENDYQEYERLYHDIVKDFQKNFFKEDGSMTSQTQTSHILALYFNLTPADYKEKTVNTLLELLRKENGHLVTGFVGTPYFCHALSQNGHVKEAYDLLLKDDYPSWLYQVKMGATTIWEHWDGVKPDGTMWSPDMNSFNHYAYGAVGEWLYRVVAGIEADETAPGYKHFIIKPHIGGGLTHVKCSYKSVYGMILVEWYIEDKIVQLKVEVPVNTTADIYLEGGKEIVEEGELNVVAGEEGYVGRVGSGSYEAVYKL